MTRQEQRKETETNTKNIIDHASNYYHVESIGEKIEIIPIDSSKSIKQFPEIKSFDQEVSKETSDKITKALEDGYVVLFPNLSFEPTDDEKDIIDPSVCNGRSKNVGYSPETGALSGTKIEGEKRNKITSLMQRYAQSSEELLNTVCPHYKDTKEQKRTSFRPIEIKGRRHRYYTEDDTRLHVDAFPMNPTHGNRILRVFANINPDNKPRTWRLGEPFESLIKRFIPSINMPLTITRKIMHLFGITKKYRTDYDHIMLKLHNNMKYDLDYQRSAIQEVVEMPANTVWMVCTDKALHGVLEGQHLLEQTYYLKPENMLHPEKSPLYILENFLKRKLR